ncbi:MAG TPA: hypothetical protein VJX66_14985 [Amycolatopsis sp.]|nr:hypothetical protein [Amycolatopsis sp.]
MTWDPFGTVHKALWIGGAPWAGKSTVARLLAARHGLTTYHHEYHEPGTPEDENASGDTSAANMLDETVAELPARFQRALDDLRALMSPRPIVAEGWGLWPELVAPLVDSPARMVVLVPTEVFRQHQLRHLSWTPPSGDQERAQRIRVARDRMLAAQAVRAARAVGIRVLEIDGTLGPERVTDVVADHFSEYLPA